MTVILFSYKVEVFIVLALTFWHFQRMGIELT